MKKKLPPAVFYTVLTLFVAFIGLLLYRQATDPIYHHEPTDEDAAKQFSKGPGASAPIAPRMGVRSASGPGDAARSGREHAAATDKQGAAKSDAAGK